MATGDSSNLIDGAGDLLEGAYFTNHYAPDVPWKNSAAFVTAFKARFNREPTSLAAQGYDAAKLLFDAIKRAPETNREAIKVALADTKNFEGATGQLTIGNRTAHASPSSRIFRTKSRKISRAPISMARRASQSAEGGWKRAAPLRRR